jgi:glycosyltransferase involved in cell wall biosynthesis
VITAIVPTYKRPAIVLRCVESLQGQTLDAFEIVLVDNATDARLREAIENLNASARPSVRYVAEPRLGLHNARHAGARAATGEILVFTDDDATFDPGWLAAYERAFREHPEMAAAGGPVRPVWEAPPPRWLLDFMDRPEMFPLLSLLDRGPRFRLDEQGLFFGVNMAIRRDVLFELGGFNPDSFGSTWLGDGETGLNRKLQERGLPIGYVPEAVVYHHVPPERMTLAYCCRRQANDGACDMFARFHSGIPRAPKLLQEMLGICRRNARDWLAAVVLQGQTSPRALRVQMRAARTRAQVAYVVRLMCDKALRHLVLKQDWLNEPEAG